MINFILKYILLTLISILLLLPFKFRSNIVWFMSNIKHKFFGSSIFNQYKEGKNEK